MKRFLLFAVLLFSICTLANAQRKTQFGLTVQAGNFLQADQQHAEYSNETTDYRLTGGILAGLGAYAERTFGRHVALHSGLNLSQSTFTEEFTTIYPENVKRGREGVCKQVYRFTVRQVSLPVQLQLRAGKQRQLAFSIGGAPSFSISKIRPEQEQEFSYLSSSFIRLCGYGYYPERAYGENLSSTKFQVLFTAGLHYRPDAHNAIGLELWLAREALEGEIDDYDPLYNRYTNAHRMRSLQVSLRHSW